MSQEKSRVMEIEPFAAESAEIGRWLWMFADARRRTMEDLDGVTDEMIDFVADDGSSIGDNLYHMALIEADWLYAEILEEDIPPAMMEYFPVNHRDADGHLSKFYGETLEQYLSRLQVVRGKLTETLKPMTIVEFKRLRLLPDYHVSAEWVCHHLLQHEAEHRSQIGRLKAAFHAQ